MTEQGSERERRNPPTPEQARGWDTPYGRYARDRIEELEGALPDVEMLVAAYYGEAPSETRELAEAASRLRRLTASEASPREEQS